MYIRSYAYPIKAHSTKVFYLFGVFWTRNWCSSIHVCPQSSCLFKHFRILFVLHQGKKKVNSYNCSSFRGRGCMFTSDYLRKGLHWPVLAWHVFSVQMPWGDPAGVRAQRHPPQVPPPALLLRSPSMNQLAYLMELTNRVSMITVYYVKSQELPWVKHLLDKLKYLQAHNSGQFPVWNFLYSLEELVTTQMWASLLYKNFCK